jgi:hypothetical protein
MQRAVSGTKRLALRGHELAVAGTSRVDVEVDGCRCAKQTQHQQGMAAEAHLNETRFKALAQSQDGPLCTAFATLTCSLFVVGSIIPVSSGHTGPATM